MRSQGPFLLVGLTGGIATGKSTVTEIFRRLGCVIIDADVLAREVVEPGEPALTRIVEAFGRGVLRPDGTLDRKALGAIVFGDADKRRRLEAITHPEIRARLDQRLAELAAQGFEGIVVFDAPVMIESGNYRTMDRLVVVVTDEATQAARLIARDGLTREEAARRITSQMPVAEKAKLADYVIDNRGDRAATEEQTRRVHAALLAEFAARARETLPRGQRQIKAVNRPPINTGSLAVLFPVDMGNYDRNKLAPEDVFRRLCRDTQGIEFVGYLRQRSGNFVFRATEKDSLARVIAAAEQITRLRCIARRFSELSNVNASVPSNATVQSRSVVLPTTSGKRRIVAVFLSEDVGKHLQLTGNVGKRSEIYCWASARDVLCLYDRPDRHGDVGQVTTAVLAKLKGSGAATSLYGTGRAMAVVRRLLAGTGLTR